MITLKLYETAFIIGAPSDVAFFYASFLSYLQVLKPTVDRQISEQEAMANVIEQLKSLKIDPIQKEEDHDGEQADAGPDAREM